MGILASLFRKNVKQVSNTISIDGSVGGSVYQDVSAQNVIIDPATAIRNMDNPAHLQDLLSSIAEVTSKKHPLYPYYETAINMDGKGAVLYSKPLIPEAEEKYPRKIKGTFSLDNPKGYPFKELQRRSYISQTPINMRATEVKRMLGEELDPHQNGIDDLLDSRFEMVPPKLPGPFRMLLSVKGTSEYFGDLMMKVQPTDPDEHMLYLSNADQGNSFTFELKWFENNQSLTIHYQFTGQTWQEIKHFISFMIAADEGQVLVLKNIEHNTDVVELPLSKPLYDPDYQYLHGDLALVSDIISVQDFFGIIIRTDEDLSDDDMQMISLLAKSIKGEKTDFHWESFSCEAKMHPAAENIDVGSEFNLRFVSVVDITIQNVTISGLKSEEELCCARFESSEHMKELIENSVKNDESISVKLVPGSEGNNGKVIIKLYDEE